MIEIRFHGRGGQGAVTAAEILAKAAFYDGKYSQAFPFFGVERRGAPVLAFVRIDNKPIRIRYQVYKPNYVIVLDDKLVESVDVFKGLHEPAVVVINSKNEIKKEGVKIYSVDATNIALETLGSPIVNTAMLGAFVGATKIIKLDSLIKAIKNSFKDKIGEKNAKAAVKGYESVVG